AVANGSNRVAVMGQSISSVVAFRRKGYREAALSMRYALPAALGSLLGSMAVVEVPDELFRKLLSVVMILATVTSFLRRPGDTNAPGEEPSHGLMLSIVFLLIGFYGGFIQAGVGFLIIAALHGLGRLPLVRTNGIKVFVVGLYTIPSLFVFVVEGKVAWLPAVILTAGHATGGWLGTHFTIRAGDRWIRIVLAAAVLAMALKLVGVF
ncbi:sulfite exporter TauE/SafE family protein, partial [Candidatus Fermentibacteria bacterium]|nr:sulfite exporter TauE/SafE family protein [Candidatus Fermentibacteria bacterium]